MADANTVTPALATLGGSGWVIPAGSPFSPRSFGYVLAQSGVPIILPSSGTSNATGQITLTTALPYQPLGTVGLYLPAGVVVGDAVGGIKQVVFSSTTVCQIVGAPATANAAYTQSTSALTLATVSVPGGAMGANGRLRVTTWWEHANSATSKSENILFAGSAMQAWTNTTTAAVLGAWDLQNRGAANLNMRYNTAGANVPQATVYAQPNIDTSIAQLLAWQVQLAAAADFIMLSGFTVEVLPAA